MRVNLSDVGSGFDPVPSGKYEARIANGELRQAKSDGDAKHPGSWYINWDLVISKGEFDGRHIFDNTSFAHDVDGNGCDCDNAETFSKALFKLKGLLLASGKYTKEELDSPEFDFEIDDIVGSEVVLNVTLQKSEEYGDQNRIKRYGNVLEGAGGHLLP